ncbi:MAG: hypothetical protein NVV82_23640 [Sporocytophaga sp.]|nr:hypothetical protein [Sporocytophaga sp.]
MNHFRKTIFLLLVSTFFALSTRAQKFTTAGEYMTYMGELNRKITEDYMSYTSAVAHGKSARKVENRRKEIIQSTKDAIKKISVMPPYKDDKALRDSAVSYLKLTQHVLNDDYAKILNMEEIAEQSYDAMEAYLLAQELASEKMNDAGRRLNAIEKEFAAKNNINLIESKDELTTKVEKAQRVNAYQRKVYLIFFKSYKQEAYLLDAIQSKNVNGIEQNKNTLQKYAEQGLATLDTMKAFSNDRTIVNACKQLLEFYKTESKDKIPSLTSFYIKEENYLKIKKAFEAKKESARTKADVDQYNKAVNEFNQSVNEFNATNNSLNDTRNKLIANYNKAVDTFLDKHTPKYK